MNHTPHLLGPVLYSLLAIMTSSCSAEQSATEASLPTADQVERPSAWEYSSEVYAVSDIAEQGYTSQAQATAALITGNFDRIVVMGDANNVTGTYDEYLDYYDPMGVHLSDCGEILRPLSSGSAAREQPQ